MRLLARLMCAVLVLGLLGAMPSASAVAAVTKRTCVTYKTHKACVVLHRNAKGRVWATSYVDKRAGRSNGRYAHVRLYSRECRASDPVLREDETLQVRGNRTASSRTTSIAWSNLLSYEATLVGGWARSVRQPSGGVMDYERRVIVLRTPTISNCD